MPHTDEIPGEALEVVADQIGRLLPRLLRPGAPPPTHVTITASFEVWKLSSAEVEQASSDALRDLAVPMERWHHQITVDGVAEVFARSEPHTDPARWSVREVTRSPVVAKLDTAIDRIDEEVLEDDLVKLLEVPGYLVRALWLIGNQGASRVLVVDAARRLTDLIEIGLHTESEFLDQLRRVEPIVGVTLSRS